MPTASTAQILGNNESFEPYTSNIYSRRVLSGEFQVVNHHLLKDLTERGLWDETMKQRLIANNGSIQVCDDEYTGCTVYTQKRACFILPNLSIRVHSLFPKERRRLTYPNLSIFTL